MCYSLIFIFCSLFTSSVSLLCYSKTCPQTKVDLCIERCPTSYNACKAVVQVDYGTHTNVELSCIQSDENCDDSYHFCVPKRTNVSNILICCCSTDYCNGGFRDAKKLYPWLTVSRLLPLLPIPAQISGQKFTETHTLRIKIKIFRILSRTCPYSASVTSGLFSTVCKAVHSCTEKQVSKIQEYNYHHPLPVRSVCEGYGS